MKNWSIFDYALALNLGWWICLGADRCINRNRVTYINKQGIRCARDPDGKDEDED